MESCEDIVTFTVDRAIYGVPVDRVREILDVRPVAPMPKAPHYLLGLIDLRGENIPVVDLRRLLGQPEIDDTPNTRILVTQMEHRDGVAVVGIRTDRVIEVTRLDDDEIRPLSQAEMLRWEGAALTGIGRRNGEIVSVVDLDNLFSGAVNAVASAVQALPPPTGDEDDDLDEAVAPEGAKAAKSDKSGASKDKTKSHQKAVA